jgi:hypothetical protein
MYCGTDPLTYLSINGSQRLSRTFRLLSLHSADLKQDGVCQSSRCL